MASLSLQKKEIKKSGNEMGVNAAKNEDARELHALGQDLQNDILKTKW
jgi:hypothetical protein